MDSFTERNTIATNLVEWKEIKKLWAFKMDGYLKKLVEGKPMSLEEVFFL